MLDKFVTSFRENLNRNSRNPFLGTLAFVWAIRNWKIVYGIFAFEDGRKFEDKLAFIESQISYSNFQDLALQFLINSGISMGIVIIIYAFMNATRFITNKYENQLTPWIHLKSAKNKIVLREDLEKAEERIKELEEKNEKERSEKSKLQTQRDQLDSDINKLSIEISKMRNEAKEDGAQKVLEVAEEKILELKKNEDRDKEKIDNVISILEKNLENGLDVDDIKYVINASLAQSVIDYETYLEEIAELVRLSLIEKVSDSSKGFSTYKATNFGLRVFNDKRFHD